MLRCPQCKSSAVQVGYPYLRCSTCGRSEPVIDFPVSWDSHRHYACELGQPDPGPLESAQPVLEVIEKRLGKVEQTVNSLSDEELRRLKVSLIYREVQDIRQGFRRIDQIVAQKLIGKKKAPIPKLTEL